VEPMNPYPSWGLLVVRGVLALFFGILALVHPLAALAAIVIVFGVWAFVDGVSALALFIGGWRSWQLFAVALIGIGLGVLTFFRPRATAFALYATVAAWAFARGILEIAVAIRLRKQIEGELWMILGGIASVVFGVLMVVLPFAGILALAWLVGVYALLYGLTTIALGVRVHAIAHPRTTPRFGAPHPV